MTVEGMATTCPNGHACCTSAQIDARAFAAVVDDLRSAVAAAHTSIPGGRKGDKARGILRQAMDRATTSLWQIQHGAGAHIGSSSAPGGES